MSLQGLRLSLRQLVVYQRCRRFMSANLLLVNTGTCCTLYAVGDLIQQRIEGCQRNDWMRTARMAVLGFFMGPINHCWYVALDRLILGHSLRVVGKKVAADQMVMAPICSSVFYIGMCVLEGRRKEQIAEELRVKFWPTYKMDWQLWPAAQVINFYFVPPSLRVTYVNIVTLFWTVYLSYMKHKDMLKALNSKKPTHNPLIVSDSDLHSTGVPKVQ